MFCAVLKMTASVEGVLYAVGRVLVLVLEVVSACAGPGVPGEQGPLSRWWDRDKSHGPDPSSAGRQERLHAGCGGHPGACENRAEARNILPTPPAISLMGFSARVGDPRACAAVCQVFPGSEPLRSRPSCNPSSSPPGWYPK